MAKKYEFIEKVSGGASTNKLTAISEKIGDAERNISNILKKLDDLEKGNKLKRENIKVVMPPEKKEQPKTEKVEKTESNKNVAPKKDDVAVENTASTNREQKPATKADVSKEKVATETKPVTAKDNSKGDVKNGKNEVKTEKKPAQDERNKNNQNNDRRKQDTKRVEANDGNQKPNTNGFNKSRDNQDTRQNRDGQQRQNDNRGQQRGNNQRDNGQRDNAQRDNRNTQQRRDQDNRGGKPQGQRTQTFGQQGQTGGKTTYNGQNTQRTGSTYINTNTRTNGSTLDNKNRGQGGAKIVPPIVPTTTKPTNKNFGADKKKGETKTYTTKNDHANSSNKRDKARQQEVLIDDYDDDKVVKLRSGKKNNTAKKVAQAIKITNAVVTTKEIAIKILSEKLGITATEITKRLFKQGKMVNVNGSITFEEAEEIALDLGIELEYKPEKTAEEKLLEMQEDTVEEIESLVPRAPVVTVMGHVDHGKTSLLDRIRKTNVTAGEAGGITQHIGAYSVTVDGKSITFIDTPGHEAFTAMRARGAKVTDIVVLVVAADDGIMPQTIEAINHSKSAGVSIIVAINKIDKPGANIERILQDLTTHGLVCEEWGGDTSVCKISCKTGEGIQDLLETILVVAEMKELLANPDREARGSIIEAQLDKGKGPIATVLVQNGTLHTGDYIISGTITGKVRAMIDDKGRTVKVAGPSTAVNVLGFESVPSAGESIFSASQDLVRSVNEERKRRESEERDTSVAKVSLDDVFSKMAEGSMKTLNLIIKGDVQGSVEAIKQSVIKLTNEEVNVKVIHSAAGAINESDVMLADSAKAIIMGFNVRPDSKAKTLAEHNKIDIRQYRVIYDLLDDVEAALNGMLTPKFKDVYLGKCEVRQTFKITGVGNIAGCYVQEGKIIRGGKLRIYRDNVLIVEGNVQQLKRFKDDVKEVAFGFECGCAIEGFNDIRIGDIIECYVVEKINA